MFDPTIDRVRPFVALGPGFSGAYECLADAQAVVRRNGCGAVYELMTASLSITCPHCGRTSSHLEDVRHGYCGNCHVFLADLEREDDGA